MPSSHALASESSATKRRRLAEKNANATQSQMHSSQRPTSDFYDPDQDVTERREIRKSLRNLTRDLHGKITISINDPVKR